MNARHLVSNCANFVKAGTNLVRGRQLNSLGALYDPRYPPTKFFQRSLPAIHVRCILCGFPRTGTHWIKNVVEKACGKPTYDLFWKKPTPSDKDVCVLKIHARNKRWARTKALWLLPRHTFGGKYVYTYRDPRDAIISIYEMYREKKGLADLEPEAFLRLYDPMRQYRWEIHSWVLKRHEDVMRIRFEDLTADPVEMFRRLLVYIGVSGSVDEALTGEKVATFDSKKRPRGTAYGWKNAPPEYQCIIDSVNETLGAEIEQLAYGDV